MLSLSLICSFFKKKLIGIFFKFKLNEMQKIIKKQEIN